MATGQRFEGVTTATRPHRWGEWTEAGDKERTEWREETWRADVGVPTGRALMCGVAVGLLVGFWTWQLRVGLVVGAAVFTVTVLVQFIPRMFSSDALIMAQEVLTRRDINQDGHIGPPPTRTLRVEVVSNAGKTEQYAEIPDTRAMWELACAVGRGESFSESTASECGLSVPLFREVRDLFVERAWAYWRNPDHPQQGVELLGRGRTMLQKLADSPAPPSE